VRQRVRYVTACARIYDPIERERPRDRIEFKKANYRAEQSAVYPRNFIDFLDAKALQIKRTDSVIITLSVPFFII